MLKVAFCITELDYGGAERCLVELTTRIDRGRFEPVVYCLGPRPIDEARSCVPALERAGIELHCFGGHGARSFPRVLHRLTRHWKRTKPDVVQTFLFHANVLGRIAARRAGVPRVVCGIRVAEHGARWHWTLDRWTRNLVDSYVCVSRDVANFSRSVTGISADRLSVIPNGIDAERFRDVQAADLSCFGLEPPRRAITFIGRLSRQKGVDWLVEAAPELLRSLRSHDLLIVGIGPLADSLRRRSQDLAIDDRVHFAGWRSDVPEILKASDLLVLPSRWEGMPNVVLEAMAAGVPVLASDVEGVRELLGRGADAQAVAYGDSASLVAKAKRLLGEPDLAAGVVSENEKRVKEKFSIGAMVAAYERLYSQLSGR